MPTFYAGTRKTVPCPDCSWPADPQFGDHGGDCAGTPPPPTRRALTGLEIIRRYALTHRFVSINEIRGEMDEQGVAETSRGPAFGAACKRGFIKPTGFLPSTDAATKRHSIRTYTSLIVSGAATTEERNTA